MTLAEGDGVGVGLGRVAAPTVSLPKGGGAIRGIGEKFAANPVTGTGSLTVPVWTTPGRGGLGPSLTLSYDSGAGNGPFGLGWSVSLPSITRRTDKGVPRYEDDAESDVFLLSGAEDLVPVLGPDGTHVPDEQTAQDYVIDRYRPRVEGLFARIERWTSRTDDSVHWRSISRDNVLTVYGADDGSRISDPALPGHVFSWLVSEVRDDRGNAVVYTYKPEDGRGVDLTAAHERNRGSPTDARRSVNRYLKRIRYGNRTPLLDVEGRRPRLLSDLPAETLEALRWMFELVLDYGEHDVAAPAPDDPGDWAVRADPFSTYRAGFECRTNRRCRRFLMYHHVPDQAGGAAGYDGLVRATELAYSDELAEPVGAGPAYSLLRRVTQVGYRRAAPDAYDSRAMPAVELTYTVPVVQNSVERVDPADLANLPVGVDGTTYQWTDLHGDGIPGILTEQAGAWFYTRNMTPLGQDGVHFAPTETVTRAPSATLTGDRARFMDLAGDGLPDLVLLRGPTPGFFEHDEEEGWSPFRTFTSMPDADLTGHEVTFVDLDGDGHADLLLADDDAWAWHPSAGEQGFGARRRIAAVLDEETGPRVVAAGSAESLVLADLSGDGLTDLVRIRNGEVCYWPNLGHGRFGAKVTMDGAPWFDSVDQFDSTRLRPADIDGSGTTDLVYLHRDGVRLYFNLSGNGWSAPVALPLAPQADANATVDVTDLFGNGTACLVWSSALPSDGRPSMQFVNLMGPAKPHLLVGMSNNLGAETVISYVSSTHFALQDRRDGRPWRTRLPFPVHVVDRVQVNDLIGRQTFVTRYAYHDGYFDPDDREFRGFGLVEEWDSDSLESGGTTDPVPPPVPVHTLTWFHTGAPAEPDRRGMFVEPGLTGEEASARRLAPPDPPPAADPEDSHDARRALKGLMLRREVYGLDAPGVPYTVTEQSFAVRRLQARGTQHHGVHLTHPDQTLTWSYERDATDPRVQHTLVLEVDPYGTVTKQAVVGYGRRRVVRVVDAAGHTGDEPNPGLVALSVADQDVQTAMLVSYSETLLTDPVDDVTTAPDDLRAPRACGTSSYQLTGHDASGPDDRLRAADLVRPDPGHPGRVRPLAGTVLPFESTPPDGRQRRLVERTRTLFRTDDLSGLLPLGQAGTRCLTGETYSLVLSPGLLDAAFRRATPDGEPEPLLTSTDPVLGSVSGDGCGYVSGRALAEDGRFPPGDPDGEWWIPSGRTTCSPVPSADAATERRAAREHFFTPRRYRDPFGHETVVSFDEHDLLVTGTVDPLGNTATVDVSDYRLLQPVQVTDANGNRAANAFDLLGMVVGTAVMGKAAPAPPEGDSLDGFVPDLPPERLDTFHDALDPHDLAADMLQGATTRTVYDLDRFRRSRAAAPDDPAAWLPTYAATLARETHLREPLPAGGLRAQIAFSFSDGFGRIVQKKIPAEPGPVAEGGPTVAPRWVGSAWTIFDAKGSPVRQYEPFFSRVTPGHHFEFGAAFGVSPVLVYDAAQRVAAALNPNATYTKVVVRPWRRVTYDVNDTCAPRGRETGDPRTDPDVGALLRGVVAAADTDPDRPWSTWYQQRIDGGIGSSAATAARQAAAHADTPTTAHLDPLGRPFLTVVHNRVIDDGHSQDGLDLLVEHRVELDLEGNRLVVRDGITQGRDAQDQPVSDTRGRVLLRTAYDLLGHALREQSIDGGTRWTLRDVTGAQVRSWDSRGHRTRTTHDPVRRVTHVHVAGTDPADPARELLTERRIHGEQFPAAAVRNLRGTLYLHLDQAGALENTGHDFVGNPTGAVRRLTAGTQYRDTVDWTDVDAVVPEDPTAEIDPDLLEAALGARVDGAGFTSHSSYDALNRPCELVAPHVAGSAASVVRHTYSEAGLLDRIEANLRGASAGGEPVWTPFVTDVDYDAKGQRRRIARGNAVTTEFEYDPLTFQLVRLRTARDPVAFADDCPQPPVPGWPGCGLQDLTFTYDPTGNITRIEDSAQQRLFFANRRVEPSSDYVYDASYQLITAGGRHHLGQAGAAVSSPTDGGHVGLAWSANDGTAMGTYTERYSYDPAGNLTELRRVSSAADRSWTTAFAYAEAGAADEGGVRWPSNRLTATTVGAAEASALAYDAHGNVVRMPHLGDGSPSPNLHWDTADRLVRVDLGGGGTTYYVHDAAGRRVRTVREKTATLVEERIDLGDVDVFRRTDGAARLERETLHVTDGGNLVALVETRTLDTAGTDQAPPQAVRYQLSDHLASVHVELDDRARIISYEEYTPFGSTTYQAGAGQTGAPKRFRFTGHERDEASGFYAMGARHYAPWLCRWISCDPAGITDSPNRYEYVANNPVRHVDTSGRGLLDRAKAFVADGANRAVAAVKPGGAVFEAVDNAFKPDAHPVSAAVLNNMAKRGEGIVEGGSKLLKQTGDDFGDIAYAGTHPSEPGATKKLTAAVKRRQQAPVEMAVGMAKGFAGQLKNVGEGLGTVAYYRPEMLGLAGAALPSHAKEQGADAKVASAITDIVLDGPQIVLTVEGGINLAKGAGGALGRPPVRPIEPGSPSLNSSNALAGVEPASPDLLAAIAKRRTVVMAEKGSEELAYLDAVGAEANVGGTDLTHILLRENPSKAAALEEFLHGTQSRVGVIKRLGQAGAETHVKDFMIRHKSLLGLGAEDVTRLQKLKDMGL